MFKRSQLFHGLQGCGALLLWSLDRWHLPGVKKLACVMRNITAEQLCRQECGWKMFILLPRISLHRPARAGFVSKNNRVDDLMCSVIGEVAPGQREM